MDEDNLNSVNGQIDQAIKLLGKFNSSTNNITKSTTILSQTQQQVANDEEKTAKTVEKLNSAVSKSVQGVVSFTKTLSNNNGGFQPLNTAISLATKAFGGVLGAIPFLGKGLKAVAEGAGEVAKFTVDSFEKSYSMFEKLSSTGVVTRFEDFTKTADALGLTYAMADRVLGTASKDFSLFAGSATRGRKSFADIAMESESLRESFQKLGVDAATFSEFQISYMAQDKITNLGAVRTSKQIAQGTEQYIEQLDLMSKITGLERKAIQDQMRARQQDARYLAATTGMDTKRKTNMDNALTVLGSFFGDTTSEGFKDMMAAAANGTIASSDAAKALRNAYSQAGIDVDKLAAETVKGSKTYIDVTNALTVGSKKSESVFRDLARQMGDGTKQTQLYTELFKGASRTELLNEKTAEEIIKTNKKNREETTGQNAALAQTKTSLIKAQRNIEALATESTFVTEVMKKAAEGIEDITIKFYKMAKIDMPEHLKARATELEALKKLAELEKQKKETEEMSQEFLSPEESMMGAGAVTALDRNLERAREEAAAATRARELAQQRSNSGSSSPSTSASPGTSTSGSSSSSVTASAPPTSGTSTSPAAASSGAVWQSESGSKMYGIGQIPGSSTMPAAGPTAESTASGSGRGLAAIRELISSVESIGGSYDTLFGNGTRVPLSTMTIAQVLQYQNDMLKRGAKSTAAGRYQFMSYTLPEYAKKAGFDFNTTLFNAATQDALADILIREKGYDAYKSGRMSKEQFLANLSNAWAGLPNPRKGGRSTYAGDGLNKSNITIDKALAQIGQARTGGIFSGPSTGYMAMLHGDEAVIPANNGAAAQQLSSSSGGFTGNTRRLYQDMREKMDELVSLFDKNIQAQNKFLKQATV